MECKQTIYILQEEKRKDSFLKYLSDLKVLKLTE